MDELVESVRTYGILSPLLARPKGEGYELVSGHRRRLAAQKLGMPTVPVLVLSLIHIFPPFQCEKAPEAACRRSAGQQKYRSCSSSFPPERCTLSLIHI